MGLLRQSVFCLDNASDTGGFAARNSVILSRNTALSPGVSVQAASPGSRLCSLGAPVAASRALQPCRSWAVLRAPWPCWVRVIPVLRRRRLGWAYK